MDPRNPDITTSSRIHEFELLRREKVPSLNIVFYEFKHIHTGARLVHLSADDDNNVFSIAFRTLPRDSTGVAHILEHAILEGSRKYPVKIFKHLHGRSLNTFLNAMTGSDFTAYPFASRNKKDFFNLLDIYLDAVFFPLLKEEVFLQEGWRYEFASPFNPDTPLMYKGVVYNEMKGAMSNPLRLFHEASKQTLFPDLIYRHVSGGDPRKIPELTYEQWVDFHKAHYHPSNAFIITYGDIPLKKILHHIHHEFLSRFDPRTPPPPISRQKPFPQPIRKIYPFPVSRKENTKRKSIVAVLWKLAPIEDFYTNLKLQFISLLLSGDTTSLLNRKLLSSNLGGGLAPVGFENSFRESVFGAGLKDTDKDSADAIENLILETLDHIARKGVPEEEILAALHQLELASREIKGNHGIPFGLMLAFRAFSLWLNNGDFLAPLNLDLHLDRLKKECVSRRICSDLVRTYLLDNPHRATVILVPDPGGLERQEEDTRKTLDTIKKKLTPEQVRAVLEQAKRLEKEQNRKEDTSCMPRISLQDISREPEVFRQEKHETQHIPIYTHPNQTNGISYCILGFRHENLPSVHWSLLSLAAEMGAAGKSYLEMGRLIRRYTGGIDLNIHPFVHLENGRFQTVLSMTGKSLPENHEAMLSLMSDLLVEPDMEDENRLAELINMQKAYAIPSVLQMGHRMAILAAGRVFSPLKSAHHHLDGLGSIQRLLSIKPSDIKTLATHLIRILRSIATKQKLCIGLTSRPEDMDHLEHSLENIFSRFPSGDGNDIPIEPDIPEKHHEAWLVNTEVSYIAKSFGAVGYQHPDSPALTVLSELMETPLYERIRAKGGAYGAFAFYESESGIFTLATYRDPHTARSIKAFDAVLDMLGSGKFTDEMLEQAIVETIRKKDVPPSPKEKGTLAYFHAIKGKTYEMRKQHRNGILNTTREDIIRVMQTYLSPSAPSNIVVITSPEILSQPECASLNLIPVSLITR